MGLTKEQMAEIRFVKQGLRVSKIVATRSVKSSRGDFFVGNSSAWESVQDDAGGMGADLIDAMDEGEQEKALCQRGMSLKRAKIAGLLLGMQVDIQAHTHALCGGALSESEFLSIVRGIKRNYAQALSDATKAAPDESGERIVDDKGEE